MQNTADAIVALKRSTAGAAARFDAVDAAGRAEIADIVAMAADGVSPVPQVEWAAILDGSAPAGLPDLIRKRGCVVVRGVFSRAQAADWNRELETFLAENDADGLSRARRPER